MKLIDLIAAVDNDPKSNIKIQICHPGKKLGRLRYIQCRFEATKTILWLRSKLPFSNRNGCDQS